MHFYLKDRIWNFADFKKSKFITVALDTSQIAGKSKMNEVNELYCCVSTDIQHVKKCVW